MRKCNKCSQHKTSDEFPRYHNKRGSKGDWGRRNTCYVCYKAVVDKNQRIRRYGVSPEAFERMMTEQKGLCAVCDLPFKETPCIDHDHETKLVRGLLHRKCNLLLGHAEDSIEILGQAVSYLQRHKEKTNGR